VTALLFLRALTCDVAAVGAVLRQDGRRAFELDARQCAPLKRRT
jgi:hypothetical protein